jgi:hypothetical protein
VTLGSGETETGIWGAGNSDLSNIQGQRLYFPISFPIPLASAPEPVLVEPEEEEAPGCPGRGGGEFPASGEFKPTIPMADPGKLCIYLGPVSEATISAPFSFRNPVYEGGGWFAEVGVSQTGTILMANCTGSACAAMGTWAVTAP